MRIIAGKKRGLRLAPPSDERIRPTTDRVKEALFGSIQFDVAGANVLDLFAGSGALGLEAASRGAGKVTLVENDAAAQRVIGQNLERMGFPENVRLIKNDAFRAIPLFQNAEKFDIVIIDPPYQSGYYERAVRLLAECGVLRAGAIIVLECDGGLRMDVPGVSQYRQKRYGTTMLYYCRYGGEPI